MLLRRILAHVSQQNWTAVFIDFCIVVLGVFIGIQVSNWNSQRVALSVEAQLIAQLESDFSDVAAALKEEIARQKRKQEKISNLLEQLRSSTLPEGDREIADSILAATAPPRLIAPPISFDELRSSGGFSVIQDRNLRRSLTSYGQAVDQFSPYIPHAIRDASMPNSPLISALRFSTATDAFETGNIIEAYDVEMLSSSASQLQVLLGWSWNGERAARVQYSAAMAVLESIDSRDK